jgi:hypothetical protein
VWRRRRRFRSGSRCSRGRRQGSDRAGADGRAIVRLAPSACR